MFMSVLKSLYMLCRAQHPGAGVKRPDREKMQDILFSQPRQPQRPPGFAPDEAPVPSRRKNRLQRELVVGPHNFLCTFLLGPRELRIFFMSSAARQGWTCVMILSGVIRLTKLA